MLDTYFVFLRCQVLIGGLARGQEEELVARAKTWLEERAEGSAAYRAYLERWGDWESP